MQPSPAQRSPAWPSRAQAKPSPAKPSQAKPLICSGAAAQWERGEGSPRSLPHMSFQGMSVLCLSVSVSANAHLASRFRRLTSEWLPSGRLDRLPVWLRGHLDCTYIHDTHMTRANVSPPACVVHAPACPRVRAGVRITLPIACMVASISIHTHYNDKSNSSRVIIVIIIIRVIIII